jgi:S1-C subfamily serine protease
MDREGAGVRIYKLKKLKAEHPQHPGVDFLLGMSYFVSGQFEAAEASHLAAIKGDQAKTNVSTEALRCIAEIAKKTQRPQAAAYCFAHLLRLDRHSNRVAEAKPFFEAAQVAEQSAPLLEGGVKALVSKLPLPELKVVRGDKKLSAEELFTAAAPSVVLIRTDSGSGSGVCVGERGLILTNAHVVGSERGEVRVTGFKFDKDKLEKLAAQKAEVVFRSDAEDIAILRIADAPDTLVPLNLEEKVQQAGGKVFAVGHPGLGDEVLEQSISDGIVSSANRTIAGKRYIQHTAAVNPGNSGGPLLNEHGHIVGIVTLKANLENVGFAIPVARLRAVFDALRK